jgi:hypothetical protein
MTFTWLKNLFEALETTGGQMVCLFLLFYSTMIPAFAQIQESDLMKQAFAGILGFIVRGSVAQKNNG